MTLFAADELVVNFGGIRAVDGVSFEVEAGQVFTIIGPNGAGKTTIFNLISRIYDPTSGRLLFRNDDITRVPPHEIARRGIARTWPPSCSSCRAYGRGSAPTAKRPRR